MIKNVAFRDFFDALLEGMGLNQERLASRIYTSRQTVSNRLCKSSGPIDFDFLVLTGAVFGLDGPEFAAYLHLGGYAIDADAVPDMAAVWELIDARDASIEEKNAILTRYGYGMINDKD